VLIAAPAPVAAPATPRLLDINVNISTLADGQRWGKVDALHVGFDPEHGTVDAYRSVYDPLWDGPVAQPADPRDWSVAGRHTDTSPALAAAASALRDAVTGTDLVRVPRRDADSTEYATIYVTYADRPVGADHLHPFQQRNGTWTLPMRTSLNDLFVDPQLGAIVEAARAVAAAAR
jgi:hypothetical protein